MTSRDWKVGDRVEHKNASCLGRGTLMCFFHGMCQVSLDKQHLNVFSVWNEDYLLRVSEIEELARCLDG